jgi:hypothetical protein
MKPTLILIGADKGGVGKTTLSRALLDFLARRDIPARAFDTEWPRGSLKRFHPAITEVIDFTDVADQMKVLDTLETTDARVTLVDLKAGNLSLSLDTFDRIGVLEAARNGQFNLGLFHVVGSSISSLEEISEVAKYVNGMEYIVARNAVNDTNFFEWDQKTYKKYFSRLNSAHEIDIPKLNEMAYEQVDLSGLTFKDFIDNKGAGGAPGNHSFVLRGYVRKWCADLDQELERLKLTQGLTGAKPIAIAASA